MAQAAARTPAPPESGRSSLRCMTSAVRVSITSAGTPATPLGKPTLFRPSLVGRAPVPPHWNSMKVNGSSRSGRVPRNTVIQIEAAPSAISRSGHRLRQRAEDQARQEVADQVPRGHRRRVLRSSGSQPSGAVT